MEEVSLVRLPPGTRVSGCWGFAVLADGFMVAEQQVEIDPAMLPHIAHGLRTGEVSVRIAGDAMLIARYGEGTWGHWLAELLPKMAVCEHKAPGRFKYVMADYVLQSGALGDRVRESCAAYGVSDDRFIPIPNGEQYSFDRLYAMTPVRSAGTLHPKVRRILNDDLKDSVGERLDPRLNLLRGPGDLRNIVNAQEVNAKLNRRGFKSVNIGTLSFREQVAAFRHATGLFSVLGSSLTGVVYSPAEIGVIAAAPGGWADNFFYGIIRTSPEARWADLRGPIVNQHPEHYRYSSFHVDAKALAAALDRLDL